MHVMGKGGKKRMRFSGPDDVFDFVSHVLNVQ